MQRSVWYTVAWVSLIIGGWAQFSIETEEHIVVPLYHSGHALYDAHLFPDGTLVGVGGEGMFVWSRDTFQTWKRRRIAPGEYRSIYGIGARKNGGVIVVVGEQGLAYRSYTAGSSWEPLQIPTQKTLYDVIVQNHIAIAVGADGTILYSGTDGANWESRGSGTTKDLYAVARYENFIVAVGEDGVIVRSTDGGYDWSVVRSHGMFSHPLFDVVALSKQRWIAVGAGTTIALSSDGGATWVERRILPTANEQQFLTCALFTDTLHGWVAGGTFELEQMIWETADGGQSWKRVPCRVDTVQGNGWTAYTTIWRAIERIGSRLVLFGERDKAAIVATQPPDGGSKWKRVVWDRLIGLSLLYGGWMEDCDRIGVVLGYPPDPRLVQYDRQSRRWSVVSQLPFVDVERYTGNTQRRYRGERPLDVVWNGNYVLVNSDFTTFWWSSDGGAHWQVVSSDTLKVYQALPWKGGKFVLRVKIMPEFMEPQRYEVRMLDEQGVLQPPLLSVSGDTVIAQVAFWDTTTVWAMVKVGDNYTVLRTTDGGQNWERLGSILLSDHPQRGKVEEIQLYPLLAVGPQHLFAAGWAVLRNSSGAPSLDVWVVHSTDGGASWTMVGWMSELVDNWGVFLDSPYIRMFAASPQHYLVVAENWGTVAYTTDGGVSWYGYRFPYVREIVSCVGYLGTCAAFVKQPILFGSGSPEEKPALLIWMHFLDVTLPVEEPMEQRRAPLNVYASGEEVLLSVGQQEQQIREVRVYDSQGRKAAVLVDVVSPFAVRLRFDTAANGVYYVWVKMATGTVHVLPVHILH